MERTTTDRAVLAAWVPTDLERGLALLAAKNDRTKSGELRHLVREAIRRDRVNDHEPLTAA